jgi:L-histidine N-alpha-methyltransferase
MTIAFDLHLRPSEYAEALATDVLAGLTEMPKTLPPKWFYDERGSELFDQITRVPEYYPTRTERLILAARGDEIAAVTRAETLVELGSGTSEKTRLLLGALRDAGTVRRFVPFDVDASVLRRAGAAIAAEYPSLDVHAVVGDFEHHLDLVPRHGRRLVAFLGSTVGNFEPEARAAFFAALRATLEAGDAFLLGTDLVKDTGRLLAAYDDSAGVTADFNRNVLSVINQRLDADFDLSAFEHVASWDPDNEWVEMRLRSRSDQVVTVAALGLAVRFAAAEEMRTEISAKFRQEQVAAELAAAGLRLTHWWTDPAGDFALSLSVPG